ncbi:MAG: hypothetical protein JWO19_1628 [Bryobacterales bacterium]|nr:hypothetical protein [Bryobacterales bacterium]
MEIVEGFIAVVIPYIVSICPHADGWGVIVYGGPEANEKDGIVMKHWVKTTTAAKLWAADEIYKRFQKEFAQDPPELVWENLVCNPPRSPA